jgi:DNA-directed RNA polymerase specialized sigma24 family protein
MDSSDFATFLAALRRGEPQAGDELDRLYRPFLCGVIHPWLADPKLRRAADSVDLCQTALLKFLTALEAGRYPELHTPEHLRRILAHIAKNTFRNLLRHERHPCCPAYLANEEAAHVAAPVSTPSQHVTREELVRLFLEQLSNRCRAIHAWRASGWTWVQIGTKLGQAPNAVRIRYERECFRVGQALGLEGWHQEA